MKARRLDAELAIEKSVCSSAFFNKRRDENEQYTQMAYEVARHHHEKWNGKGYPDGLKRKEIPLCARIMAIADVFDAVSEKRCYRDAMPLEQCFEIIAKGSGQAFEPLLVEVFLDIREKIEYEHYLINRGNQHE